MSVSVPQNLPAWLKPFTPFLQWWPRVNRDTARIDTMAGLTGALVALPQCVAFATIAGMPPEYGLYAGMIPAVIAALFGSSWHLVSGPTTAASIVLFSVLAPHAGPSRHANQGQRVVAGARLMQAASDLFLGWLQGENGKHFYVRQLRDMKISALLVGWDFAALQSYGRLCGWALARAHARSGDAAMLAGYLGQGATFDEAVADFAVAYAEQNERDYMTFVTAIREGRVPVAEEM